ncbi:hypothetical protein AeRB84_020126, partial [Aphanomyces euteiches]
MDIWQSNSISQAYTSHPCIVDGQTRCSSPTECGDDATNNRFDGVCDKDGCDFNPYRMNSHDFYGPGSNFKVDSTKPVTVVTQFITDDNTANGNLVEIKRFYVQNGKAIDNSAISWTGIDPVNLLTDKVCDQAKTVFGDTNDHSKKGGLKVMGDALKKGVVLTMSLWVDYAANCLWLDSTYPVTKNPSVPGAGRGTCATSSGVPADVLAQSGSATVKYGNIRVGDLGSTTTVTPPSPSPSTPSVTPLRSPAPIADSSETPEPTDAPSDSPTDAPSDSPTDAPSDKPTDAPSDDPTDSPSNEPTDTPSEDPTDAPSDSPTDAPSDDPTPAPSLTAPSDSIVPIYYQCGGINHKGPTQCAPGLICKNGTSGAPNASPLRAPSLPRTTQVTPFSNPLMHKRTSPPMHRRIAHLMNLPMIRLTRQLKLLRTSLLMNQVMNQQTNLPMFPRINQPMNQHTNLPMSLFLRHPRQPHRTLRFLFTINAVVKTTMDQSNVQMDWFARNGTNGTPNVFPQATSLLSTGSLIPPLTHRPILPVKLQLVSLLLRTTNVVAATMTDQPSAKKAWCVMNGAN